MKLNFRFHNRFFRLFILLIVLASISLSSCKSLIGCSFHDFIKMVNFKYHGDRSPEVVEKFLKKRHYHYDYSFLTIDTLLSKYSEPKYNNELNYSTIAVGRSTKFSLLQARVFNSDGTYYSSYSQCFGDFESKDFLKNYPPVNAVEHGNINKALLLKNEFDLVHTDSTQVKTILEQAKKFTYVIVVYWDIEANYFSERILEKVSRLKRKHPNEIMVILVNNDK